MLSILFFCTALTADPIASICLWRTLSSCSYKIQGAIIIIKEKKKRKRRARKSKRLTLLMALYLFISAFIYNIFSSRLTV